MSKLIKTNEFKGIHDGNWHRYKVEMPISGVLKVLKIQPSSDKGLIELRNIEMASANDHYIRGWPLY